MPKGAKTGRRRDGNSGGGGKSASGLGSARRSGGFRRAGDADRRLPLSRERIVAIALEIVEERGLPGLTFRGMGEALGCEAMSIYHHYPSKRHLLDAMTEHALSGIAEPPEGLDGIARLRFLGREYRAMAHRHPKLFQLVALHRLDMPKGVAFVERMLRHFHVAIPDDWLAAQAFRVLGYYVIGAALDETSGYAAGRSAALPVSDEHIARDCPQLAAAAPYFKHPHVEPTFALGFEILLQGISDLRDSLREVRSAPKPVIRPKT